MDARRGEGEGEGGYWSEAAGTAQGPFHLSVALDAPFDLVPCHKEA